MTTRREYGLALALLAAGGIGLVLAYGLTWVTVDVTLLPGSDDALAARGLTGREVQPGAGAAGWVALAAVAGIVATRSWGRSIVAVVGLLAGLAGLGGALAFVASPPAGDIGAAWLPAALAGAVAAGASAWALVRGRSWPVMGRRYERGTRAQREVSPWEAQDLGRDPTDDLVE